MKTKMKKISLGLIVLVVGVVFSSFIGKREMGDVGGSEKRISVYSFVQEQICEPIRLASKNKRSAKEFSRCASGYHPSVNSSTDDTKTNAFVYGTIQLYKGCSPTYVCDFKVCVDKNYAMVKSKGSKAYITVNEWISEQKRNQEKKDVVVKLL